MKRVITIILTFIKVIANIKISHKDSFVLIVLLLKKSLKYFFITILDAKQRDKGIMVALRFFVRIFGSNIAHVSVS